MNVNSRKSENTSCGTRVFIPFNDDNPEETNYLLHRAKNAFVRQLYEALWSNHWFCVRISQQVRTGFGPRDERGQWITFTLEFGEVKELEYPFSLAFESALDFPLIESHQSKEKEEGLFKCLWNRLKGLFGRLWNHLKGSQ